MKWIYLLLGVYAVYYLVVVLADLLKGGKATIDEEDTQIISVHDMLRSKNFKARKMELSDDVRKEYMNNGEDEPENYRPKRVIGAVYAQGFEVSNYNAVLMRGQNATFDAL